ncbi:MAG: chromate efflux transporter, partial [Sphingobium sp.]
MTTIAEPDLNPAIRAISLLALFLKFLRFGCLAFGGPVAQIAMIRQALVEEERWISRARFNRLLAIMQILPGPEAHELCVHMGMTARGRIGGLLAGLGFMLPGLVLMLLAGWAYRDWIAGAPGMASALLGIQLVVLAIIARAVQRIGGHVLEDRQAWLLAIGSFVATLLGTPFWIPLVAAGLLREIRARRGAVALILLASLALAILLHRPLLTQMAVAQGAGISLGLLFIAGLKGGLLTFGGAYTAIPYVRADTVGRGWLSDASFLDGVAFAGILPAPLVIFATFVGYVTGGLPGALVITAGMFLPAFAFSMIFFERLESVVENPALHHILAGVAAAVVGVIAATLVELATATFARTSSLIVALPIVALAAIGAWRIKGKWAAPLLLLLGGLAGWL